MKGRLENLHLIIDVGIVKSLIKNLKECNFEEVKSRF
jgi:hypothetical protein